jgi:hypothetical protein
MLSPIELLKLAATALLAASLTAPPANAQRTRGDTEIPVVRNIGMPEYIDMANEVAAQLLQSQRIQEITARAEAAKLVLGIPQNNSARWDVQAEDIFDTVRNRLVSEGRMRVFSTGATDVEYIVTSEFTSTRTVGRRNENVLTFTLTLTTIEGEFIGSYSSHRAFVQ